MFSKIKLLKLALWITSAIVILFQFSNIYQNIENIEQISESSCDDENWAKQLDLFIPDGVWQKWYRLEQLFQSMSLFWPSTGRVLIITDDDDENNFFSWLRNVENKFIENLEYSIPYEIKFNKFNKILKQRFVGTKFAGRRGWNRQQWLMFWPENFTRAEYVGFLDSDAFFVTRVAKGDIFHNGKPIIRARTPRGILGHKAPEATLEMEVAYKTTGYFDVMDCMSYFPVVFKTSHFAALREHIRKHMGLRTFDEAFAELITMSRGKYYSQFRIMCSFFWHHNRDDYHWSLYPLQNTTVHPSLIGNDLLENRTPHIAVHRTYENISIDWNDVMKMGVLFSMTNDQRKQWLPQSFHSFQPYEMINQYEWIFEGYNLIFNNSLKAHIERLDRNSHCPHRWRKKAINNLFGLK